MKLSELFSNTESVEKTKAIENLISHSSPRAHFFFMVLLSVCMATMGILLNSTVVLIGSMLIAPMLYPVLSLAMGFSMGDFHLIYRSVVTLFKSFVIAVSASFLLSIILHSTIIDYASLAKQFSNKEFLFFSGIVAVISGMAGAYALIKTELSENLPGIAIAVALVPPLASIGVALANFNTYMMRGALLLFILNVLGVVFSAGTVFSLFKLGAKRAVAVQATKQDEKEIEKEKEKATS